MRRFFSPMNPTVRGLLIVALIAGLVIAFTSDSRDAVALLTGIGSGVVLLVWLGRRRIGGIAPGRVIRVEGRIGLQDGQRVVYNPRYELRSR